MRISQFAAPKPWYTRYSVADHRHVGRPCDKLVVRAERLDGAEILRSVPLAAGAAGIAAVLLNRVASGLEPALMASSSQSRADVVVIFVSAVLTLTGLQWLSLKPKVPATVELEGEVVNFVGGNVPEDAAEELSWVWRAVQWATPAKSMVVFKDGKCIMHAGFMGRGTVAGAGKPGAICKAVQSSGKSNYLANLVLFPGRGEFHQYLPINTQSVVIQPFGKNGSIVIGAATQRGFTILDQAWISAWVDKVIVSLNEGD